MRKEHDMTRTIAIALSSLLAFAGFSQAQSYSRTGTPTSYGRLENNYQPAPARTTNDLDATRYMRTYRSPNGGLGTVDRNNPAPDEFKPLAYLNRLYVNAYGREPSEAEARYWIGRMDNTPRETLAAELALRGPQWAGHYDPRYGRDVDWGPGTPGSAFLPDPASLSFRDPGGPYFKSPYWPNYEYRRNIRAFSYGTVP
jgi:hypothetical protein